MLEHVTIGWIWLERTLNGIIDALNQQKPLASASIAIEESPNGTVLKAVAIQAAPAQGTDAGAAGAPGAAGGGGAQKWPAGVGWQRLTVMDTSGGSCTERNLYYWGTAPGAPPPQ
jgi:hypothetical protein